MSKKMQSSLLLLIAAFIWGSAFVAQRSGMAYIGPLTFMFFRSLLACLFLAAVYAISRAKARKAQVISGESAVSGQPSHAYRKHTLAGGISCGVVLFAASLLQQYGLVTVSAGKTGFITALYLALVPIFAAFLGKKPRIIHVICVPIALLGLWLLNMKGASLSIGRGEFLDFLCAIGFAWHILFVDRFSASINGVLLSLMQFTVCTILSFVGMLLFETPSMPAVASCFVSIAYAGLLSSGIAFTFQILAQKHIEPTVACFLMSLESVFSVLSGWLVLHEHLNLRELSGCAIVFAAVLLSQLASSRQPVADADDDSRW